MIKITVVEHDVSAAVAGAELLDHVRPAVVVRVTQRKNLAVQALGINVAVRRDGEAAEIFRRPADALADDQIVSVNQRAKTGRKRDTAVVRIGCGQSCDQGRRGHSQGREDYGDCSHF